MISDQAVILLSSTLTGQTLNLNCYKFTTMCSRYMDLLQDIYQNVQDKAKDRRTPRRTSTRTDKIMLMGVC